MIAMVYIHKSANLQCFILLFYRSQIFLYFFICFFTFLFLFLFLFLYNFLYYKLLLLKYDISLVIKYERCHFFFVSLFILLLFFYRFSYFFFQSLFMIVQNTLNILTSTLATSQYFSIRFFYFIFYILKVFDILINTHYV